MRAVIQRVTRASVTIEGEIVGAIGHGLLVLLGITHSDSAEQARWLAEKVVNLRIFNDDDGKMNRSVAEIDGSILVVSQFTLYGDAQKGAGRVSSRLLGRNTPLRFTNNSLSRCSSKAFRFRRADSGRRCEWSS